MKKFFTLLALAICSLTAMATEYTGTFDVKAAGLSVLSAPGTATLTKEESGEYTLTIPSLTLDLSVLNILGLDVPVTLPQINVPGILGTINGGVLTLNKEGQTDIDADFGTLDAILGNVLHVDINSATVENNTLTLNTDLTLLSTIPALTLTFTGTAPAPTVVSTTDYPGLLTANINSALMTFPGSTITINEMSDGTYQLVVPSFEPVDGITVPAITIPGVTGTKNGDNITFDGTTTSVDLDKLGTANVTLNSAVVTDGDLTLDATVGIFGGAIKVGVTFGPDTETGINGVTTTADNAPKAIYGVNGQQVTEMIKGNVYIVKYADGTSKKVTK